MFGELEATVEGTALIGASISFPSHLQAVASCQGLDEKIAKGQWWWMITRRPIR